MTDFYLPTVLAANTQDVISVNIWQMLISLANLLIIFLILKKLLFKPVQKMLDARQQAIDDTVGQAESAKADALSHERELAERLAGADAESERRIKTATDIAKRESDRILADARSDADAMLSSAKEQIALEQRKADEQMKKEITDLSAALAEKMLEREIDVDDHKKLIDDFIGGIGDKDN